ncbi:hypothetical protein DFH06DRAFT_1349838 [Mycena polygramma]|nr:hypothetical protein DFH06DRAFT_1349838 [Mycena polygramma]
MSDFTLVDPRGWEYDLHSVYSAYIGYFQVNNIAWYDRSWGHLFSTFEDFLAFSWPVITITDVWTGRAHIVTRLTSIGAFLKMIKTRFGETLPQAPNILQVSPFESTSRHLRTVSDYASYKKLHSTLPAAVLSALKLRVRAGEPKAVRELWAARDRTYLAIDFEWSERNEKSCLEWGKGHYIVSEYVDKVVNKHCPTHPWQYAFGESQVCPKAKLPQIIQAKLYLQQSRQPRLGDNSQQFGARGARDKRRLVADGGNEDQTSAQHARPRHGHLRARPLRRRAPDAHDRPAYVDARQPQTAEPRLDAQPRKPPALPPQPADPAAHNPALQTQVLIPGQFPQPGAMVPGVVMHNSGNDAFMCLYALQLLLQPEGTQAPVPQKKMARAMPMGLPRPVSFMGPSSSPNARLSPSGMVGDFAQMQMHARTRSGSPLLVPPSPVKPGHANGNGMMGRSSKRLSATPERTNGWRE